MRPIRILGIDPGLRRTGWGMVEIAGNALSFLGCGSVTTNDRDTLSARLLAIHDGLMRILDEFRPDEAAVEATFVSKDARATLKTRPGARHCHGGAGQGRRAGRRICAEPDQEKHRRRRSRRQGAGADDDRRAVCPRPTRRSDDAADALAIAVTHAHHRQSAVLKVAIA